MVLDVTGADADAYDTVANVDTYWENRNNATWAAAATRDKEAAIREATQYIDSKFRDRFVGVIQSTSQALEWPRTSAWDRSGRPLNGVPTAVKHACAELALAALSERLIPVEDRGDKIKSKTEKVGPITETTEYAEGAPAGRTYAFAEMLLTSVLKAGRNRLTRV